jgi:hypothetical protein
VNFTHPLVAFGGFILGLVVAWVRGHRPLNLDITIRNRDERESE